MDFILLHFVKYLNNKLLSPAFVGYTDSQVYSGKSSPLHCACNLQNNKVANHIFTFINYLILFLVLQMPESLTQNQMQCTAI